MTLKQLREKSSLSQEALARRLEVSRVTIANWEAGDTEPSATNARKLARALGVPVGTIIDAVESAHQEKERKT